MVAGGPGVGVRTIPRTRAQESERAMPVEPARLRMRFRRFEQFVAPAPGPGSGFRTFRPGDEVARIAIDGGQR